MSTIYVARNQYHVIMEVAPRYWQDPETLKDRGEKNELPDWVLESNSVFRPKADSPGGRSASAL
jgi:hypothetical protein